MEAQSAPSSSTDPREPVVLELRASKQGRLHGKAWKSDKVATRRSYISSELKTPFEKRMEKSKAHKALLAVEQEMKESEQEAKDRKVTLIRERRERQAEKQRMEERAAKMSAKRLQRLKKGRSKKING